MSKVKLTRRVTFSAGHRYWLTYLSPAENHDLFGKWASPFNHGHNYALEVTVEGDIDPATGMVINIKCIDDLLEERIVAHCDQRSLNDEVPFFFTHPPTVENMLAYVRQQLAELPSEVTLTQIRLFESEFLYGMLMKTQDNWQTTLTRVYEFAAAHRLHAPSLSAEKNVELFGKCNNAAGHGHNYVVEVTVTGEINETTGMICDIGAMDKAIEAEVVERYDHKNLNEDLEEFRGRTTSSEVLVQEIWKRLDGKLPATLERVRLLETARNIFEVARG